jgi:hypothetical protein
VRGVRGVGQGVRGVTPGTPTRPEQSGGLGVSAATRCGRVLMGAVEGACAVWAGVAGRARALPEAFEAKAGAAPADRFGLVRPAVACVVVGGQPGPRRGGVRRLGGCRRPRGGGVVGGVVLVRVGGSVSAAAVGVGVAAAVGRVAATAAATAAAATAAASAAAAAAAAATNAAATTAAAAMPCRAAAMPRAGGSAGFLGADPGQQVVNEGRIAGGGLGRLFGWLVDEPIGDPGLAGKGNPFLGGQDAVDCPELEAGGQDAPQGGCCAEGLFSAGRGRGNPLLP